jgi:Lipid A 3-O-deacylase (PagL)
VKRLAFLFILLNSCAMASDKYLALGAGCSGIVRSKDRCALVQVEYQPNPIWAPKSWFDIRPQAGFFMNFRTSGFIYGGFRFEFLLGKHLLLTPGFAPGIYIEGQGKKLHFPIEFKSSFELAFQYRQATRRLGLQFYHLSHAHIGGHKNPGTEMLVLTYSFKI